MPTSYPLPSWLQTSPTDVANKFVSGLQIGAQLGEARNRLTQQAQQSSIENQVTQEKLAASAMQQAQELQVKKAYEDQQVQLAQQKIAAAQQKVGLETQKAARQFQAQQQYQKDLQEGLDMGLSDEEAARSSYFKNLVQFGSPAGVASAMRPIASRQASIPQTMDVPDITGKPHRYIYRGPGSTMHEVGATKSGPDFFTQKDYTALQSELRQLQKAQVEPMAQIDKVGTAQRAARIQQIGQELQKLRSGSQQAPATSGKRFVWNAQAGKIEEVPAAQSAPTTDDESYTGEE